MLFFKECRDLFVLLLGRIPYENPVNEPSREIGTKTGADTLAQTEGAPRFLIITRETKAG